MMAPVARAARRILALSLFSAATPSFATAASVPISPYPPSFHEWKYNFGLDPVLSAFGYANGKVESPISQRTSLGLQLSYSSSKSFGVKDQAYGAALHGKLALGESVRHTGAFALSKLSYASLALSNNSSSASSDSGTPRDEVGVSMTGIGVSALCGYQWFVASGLNFEIAGGATIQTHQNIKSSEQSNIIEKNRIKTGPSIYPAWSASIGFAF